MYEETLTGWPHQRPVSMKMLMQFNVMPWTSLGVDAVQRHAQGALGKSQRKMM